MNLDFIDKFDGKITKGNERFFNSKGLIFRKYINT